MSYTIPDEPRPSPWNHLVVRPNAPLLASMLCGAWLAWPWFVVNAIAMGALIGIGECQLAGKC